MGQIRKKMESAGAKTQIIQTVRGVGYRFNPPDAAPPAQ
ncbi:MAG: helix-turn-helix domain-containing protein [Limnothrix sp.]|nr:helix-turn-helix domain-containing protein [Limnothrix sp.]